jgi:hypothetical protein
MQTKSEWIKLVQDDKRQDKARRVTSPYDVPEAFRVTALDAGRFVIEFKYIDSVENAIDIRLAGDVRASLGKSTKRILAIEFKPADHDLQELLAKLRRIIQQLSEKEEFKRQAEWNYRATREAVDHTMPSIKERLSGILSPLPAH